MNTQLVNTQRIYMVLDRLAHHSTAGTDLEHTVLGLRRLLNGGVPSEVLRKRNSRKSTSDEALQAVIADLRERLEIVEHEKAASEHEKTCQIEALTDKIAKLQDQLDGVQPKSQQSLSQDFYSYDEVLQTMVTKFGKHHGVPAALFERNARLMETGEVTDRITSSAFQQWRKENRYPRYVLDQIMAMTADDLLSRGKWTEVERQFLADLYSGDPSLTNKALADACAAKFDRLVTECSIKGELNRLRQQGKVSRYRN